MSSSETMVEKIQDFLHSARDGNLSQVEKLIEEGIDINCHNKSCLGALHVAGKEKQTEIAKLLINNPSISIDASSNNGCTALHTAALAGSEEIVQMLLDANANVNAQTIHGFTALYMAAQDNHINVVKLLLANGADQSLTTEDGFTPMNVAKQQKCTEVVEILKEHKVPEEEEEEGYIPPPPPYIEAVTSSAQAVNDEKKEEIEPKDTDSIKKKKHKKCVIS